MSRAGMPGHLRHSASKGLQHNSLTHTLIFYLNLPRIHHVDPALYATHHGPTPPGPAADTLVSTYTPRPPRTVQQPTPQPSTSHATTSTLKCNKTNHAQWLQNPLDRL